MTDELREYLLGGREEVIAKCRRENSKAIWVTPPTVSVPPFVAIFDAEGAALMTVEEARILTPLCGLDSELESLLMMRSAAAWPEANA